MTTGFKICTIDRCSPLDERAVANLHSSGLFCHALAIDDRDKRDANTSL